MRPSARLWLLGPALVAGVAYLDPGNVAANLTAGARYGYLLVWVIAAANIAAWLVQYLSAKLGVVTGQSLPQLIAARLKSRWLRRGYWAQAQLVIIATELAEIIGGAVALQILFGLPLIAGALLTAAVSMLLLAWSARRGPRALEAIVIGFIAIIVTGFGAGLTLAPPNLAGMVGGLRPQFAGDDSVLLAASILGATIMPHAIYAHSSLSRDRHRARPGSHEPAAAITLLLSAQRLDVTVAMLTAGAVNLGMLLLAAAALAGRTGTDTLAGAHAALGESLGPVIATLFALALLASGLASSVVGGYAGAELTDGLLRTRIRPVTRRLMAIVPALAVIAWGVEPTRALVASQVVLSFGIPFALIPLVWLTAQPAVLGRWRNRMVTTTAAGLAATAVVALNGWLIAQAAGF